jgi:hypothetical protein
MDSPYHLVLTDTAIALLRWPGADWRDVQDHVAGYVTSFGPIKAEDVLDLIEAEWPDLATLRAADLARFFAEGEARLVLSGALDEAPRDG